MVLGTSFCAVEIMPTVLGSIPCVFNSLTILGFKLKSLIYFGFTFERYESSLILLKVDSRFCQDHLSNRLSSLPANVCFSVLCKNSNGSNFIRVLFLGPLIDPLKYVYLIIKKIMCMSFACVYTCALHADLVPAEVRHVNQVPWFPGIVGADRCKRPCAVLVTDPGSP